MNVIKTLTKSLREFKKETVLSPVLVSLEVVVECLIPLYMVTMLEKIEADNSIENILFWGGILLLMAAVSLLFGMLAGRYAAKASAGFSKNLRTDIYNSVQGFSFANIDKFSASSLVTRMTTDVVNIQNAFMMIIRIAVRSPIMLVVSVIMSFTINWKIALIFLAIIPVLGVGLFLIFRKVDPIFAKVFKKYDAMNESIQENIKGIRVVKSYVREDYERSKFNRTAQNVRADFQRGEMIIALNSPLMQFAIWTAITAVCIFGSKIIFQPHRLRRAVHVRAHDALHGHGDDLHRHLVRGACRGSAQRKEYPHQPRGTHLRSAGRQCGIPSRQFQVFREGGALRPFRRRSQDQSGTDGGHPGRHGQFQDLAGQPHPPSLRRHGRRSAGGRHKRQGLRPRKPARSGLRRAAKERAFLRDDQAESPLGRSRCYG